MMNAQKGNIILKYSQNQSLYGHWSFFFNISKMLLTTGSHLCLSIIRKSACDGALSLGLICEKGIWIFFFFLI